MKIGDIYDDSKKGVEEEPRLFRKRLDIPHQFNHCNI